PSVSIISSPSPLCGTGTFTASPANGGCAPVYRWQLNGAPVTGMPLNTGIYTNAALNPNDRVSVILLNNALCATSTTDTSNTITNSLPVVAPVLNGAATICTNGVTPAFTNATA